MNTYIVRYAPINCHGNGYALQDLKFAKILSQLDKEKVKLEFKNKCDKANLNIKSYKGMHIEVLLLEDFLKALPTDEF